MLSPATRTAGPDARRAYGGRSGREGPPNGRMRRHPGHGGLAVSAEVAPTDERRRRLFLARLVLVAAAILIAFAAWRSGFFARLSDPASLAAWIADAGPWGYAGFVFAYTVLHPIGVPGTVFVVAAPLIWPWPQAFLLSMIGTTSASVVAFSAARFLARGWVAERIPARLRRYDVALERHAFETVVILRLVLWMPQALHAFFAVSRVGFWTHLFGSMLGYIPPLLVVSVYGASVFDASGSLQPGAWPILLGLVAASSIVAFLAHLWGKHRMRSP